MLTTPRLKFCTNVSLAAPAIVLTSPLLFPNNVHVVDLRVNQDLGVGTPAWVRFRVSTAFTVNAGTPRVIPCLMLADDTGFTSNVYVPAALGGGTPLLLGAIGSLSGFVAATLPLNRVLWLTVPPVSLVRQRYMSVGFLQPDFGASSFATGGFDAELVTDLTIREHYPDAITA